MGEAVYIVYVKCDSIAGVDQPQMPTRTDAMTRTPASVRLDRENYYLAPWLACSNFSGGGKIMDIGLRP